MKQRENLQIESLFVLIKYSSSFLLFFLLFSILLNLTENMKQLNQILYGVIFLGINGKNYYIIRFID